VFRPDRAVHIFGFGLGINWTPYKGHPVEQRVIPFAVQLGKKWSMWTASGYTVTSISAHGNVSICLCNLSIESYLLKKHYAVIMTYVLDRIYMVSPKGFGKDKGPHVHNQCQSHSFQLQTAAVAYSLHLFCRLLNCSYIHNILFLKCPQMATAVCSFLWNKRLILVQTIAVGFAVLMLAPSAPVD